MSVPGGPGTGREVDACGPYAGGPRGRGDGVYVDGAGEIVLRPRRGLGAAASGDLHGCPPWPRGIDGRGLFVGILASARNAIEIKSYGRDRRTVRDGFGVPVPPVRRAIRGEVWSLTLLLVSVSSSEPIGRRSPAEHRLEVAAFGVLAPKQFGRMGGLVLQTRAEGSDYRSVRDVDALARQCFVEHPCVGHFHGVRDHGARAVRARGDGGPPG